MSFASATALAAAVLVACGSSDDDLASNVTSSDSGTAIQRDSAVVDPADGGSVLDAAAPLSVTCDKYCDLLGTNCKGANQQYASREECMAFCAHVPLTANSRMGAADQKSAPSIACRQYFADTPSQTNPDAYCLAAGPFGGNACGDRCTAFCDVVLSVCSPDAGKSAPYADRAACTTACTDFSYRDAGSDGGGEGPSGPDAGDTLNCRLWQLRAAVIHPDKCGSLKSESNACKD